MMGIRCGDLDPTVVTFLARARPMTPDAVEKLVNEESGLLGVSGQSRDMRDLLERAASDPRAADAIELYCYIARKHFGALAAVLGGVDTIVFTGGVGEHAPAIRDKICGGLEHLGVQLDRERNAANDAVISAENSRVVVRVMATDEDLVIARHVAALLTKGASRCLGSILPFPVQSKRRAKHRTRLPYPRAGRLRRSCSIGCCATGRRRII